VTDTLDCIVIGAGVVGLAVARQLALSGREVVVLEAEDRIGCHTSSRNSEVIHAGLYYPQDSLKARLCVAGKQMLYDYCRDHQVPHARLGKLIVATAVGDEATLDDIARQATLNGVGDLERLDRAAISALEPAVTASAALLSPSTGIVDSHALMLSLQGDLEAGGGSVVLRTDVSGVAAEDNAFVVDIGGGETARCRQLVNSAGLRATRLAARIAELDTVFVPTLRFARGHYYNYPGRSPFSHLVYPVPFDGGLGIHATNDLSGAVRFGPDAVWLDDVDYTFDESRRAGFVDSIRRFFPSLDADKLQPSYTGVRPILYASGESPADFRIDGPDVHGMPGLVNLFGIESPGLTACLAIADRVHDVLVASA